MRISLIFLLLLTGLFLTQSGCSNGDRDQIDSTTDEKIITQKYPDFNADTAFLYIEKQLGFGPRVPGLVSHKKCADWLFTELKKYCDTVYYQKGTALTYDKKEIPVYNIVGSFLPEKIQRAMLASHWDSRPWGDEDTKDRDKPIPAANDGASGVAVLLEMARLLHDKKPGYGVDLVLFDAEDYGKSEHENSFCLGSQYWGKNPHIPNYKAQFGVLLDMVGGKNAQFRKEAYSAEYAGFVQTHLWNIAYELGYANTFANENMGQIIDDHKYVYEATKIPMIDIIQSDPKRGFASYWHTHSDNLESVDKNTLKIVGNVMMAFVFNPPVTINP